MPNNSRVLESCQLRSQSEIVELSFDHTITDFNLLPQKAGECLFSPVFYATSHPSNQWRVRIYPKGFTSSSKRFSLFLERVNMKDKEDAVTVKIKLTLWKNGKKLSSVWCIPCHLSAKANSFGWPDCLSQDLLRSETKNQTSELKMSFYLVCEVKRNWITSSSRSFENGCFNLGKQQQQKIVELNYEWIVEEPIFLVQENGESFYSPIFHAKANPGICWRLRIYPKGATAQHADYFSLFLERVILGPDDPPVLAKFKFSVSFNSKRVFSHSGIQLKMGRIPLPDYWGWERVEKLSYFKLDSKSLKAAYNKSDSFKISCQLVYAV